MPPYSSKEHFTSATAKDASTHQPEGTTIQVPRAQIERHADRFSEIYGNVVEAAIEKAENRFDDGTGTTMARYTGYTMGAVTGVAATVACAYPMVQSGAIVIPHVGVGLMMACGAGGAGAGYAGGSTLAGKMYDAFAETDYERMSPLMEPWLKLEYEDALRLMARDELKTRDELISEVQENPKSHPGLKRDVENIVSGKYERLFSDNQLSQGAYHILNDIPDEDIAGLEEAIDKRMTEINALLENEERDVELLRQHKEDGQKLARLHDKYVVGPDDHVSTDPDFDKHAELEDWVETRYDYELRKKALEHNMSTSELLEEYKVNPAIAPDLMDDLYSSMSSSLRWYSYNNPNGHEMEKAVLKEAISLKMTELGTRVGNEMSDAELAGKFQETERLVKESIVQDTENEIETATKPNMNGGFQNNNVAPQNAPSL